ncbi:MAG: hypothetical protein HKN57_08175 [Xanthomonadales bacterium]|nr:hypothetical protein [Gammaproteobacteria bacterium]NND57215.1 hypothetical protein [Xanthomonadales bacterium]
MSEPDSKGLIEELKRRKVYRVAATYAAVAFVVVQIADLVLPAFDTSGIAYRWVVIAVLVGFPVAAVLAWVFELTPEGLRITRTDSDASLATSKPGLPAKLEFLLVTVVVLAAIWGAWFLTGRNAPQPEPSHSLAVLPFTEVGELRELSFADGVHDDLLTRLSNIHGLTVIARSSVEPYRGSDKTVSDIAQELGVRWILEGDVQQIGDKARVQVRLVDPVNGAQSWGDSFLFTLSAADLFAVQSKITHRIADALEIRLAPEEERSVSVAPTENLEAYRLFIKAQTLLEQREEPQMRRALTLFEEATDLDPYFTLAWVGVADTLYELVDYGFPMPEGTTIRARNSAERALQLDPENPEAHVSLGIIHHISQDGIRSLSLLNRAIKLRPSYAEAFSKISWVAQILGRLELASQSAEQAIMLSPLAIEPMANFAMTRVMNGDYSTALDALRSKSDAMQAWPTLRFYEGVALHHMGRYDEAAKVLQDLKIPWAGEGPLTTVAMSYAAMGDDQAARSIIGRLRQIHAHPFLVAIVLASLGEKEAAFLEIESIQDWSINADWPILAARFLFPAETASLRVDARYDRMLRHIDRAWGLVE